MSYLRLGCLIEFRERKKRLGYTLSELGYILRTQKEAWVYYGTCPRIFELECALANRLKETHRAQLNDLGLWLFRTCHLQTFFRFLPMFVFGCCLLTLEPAEAVPSGNYSCLSGSEAAHTGSAGLPEFPSSPEAKLDCCSSCP